MSDEQPKPPKRRGRPPRDQAGGPTGRASFHIGLRLSDFRRDQLLALVADANERARAAGLPTGITPSALVQLWIGERLDAETTRLARKRR